MERTAQAWKVGFLLLKVFLLCATEEKGEMHLVPFQLNLIPDHGIY